MTSHKVKREINWPAWVASRLQNGWELRVGPAGPLLIRQVDNAHTTETIPAEEFSGLVASGLVVPVTDRPGGARGIQFYRLADPTEEPAR